MKTCSTRMHPWISLPSASTALSIFSDNVCYGWRGVSPLTTKSFLQKHMASSSFKERMPHFFEKWLCHMISEIIIFVLFLSIRIGVMLLFIGIVRYTDLFSVSYMVCSAHNGRVVKDSSQLKTSCLYVVCNRMNCILKTAYLIAVLSKHPFTINEEREPTMNQSCGMVAAPIFQSWKPAEFMLPAPEPSFLLFFCRMCCPRWLQLVRLHTVLLFFSWSSCRLSH